MKLLTYAFAAGMMATALSAMVHGASLVGTGMSAPS